MKGLTWIEHKLAGRRISEHIDLGEQWRTLLELHSGATRTNQIIGTVDPFVEYLTAMALGSVYATDGNTYETTTTITKAITPMYSIRIATQKPGLGVSKHGCNSGIVHQYTLKEVQLYVMVTVLE